MQAAATRAANAYYQTQVQSQSPLELVVMLYDGAIRFLRNAADAMRRRDLVAKRDAMSRALAILAELQNTLNLDAGGEVAASLDALYTYATARLTDANLQTDPAPIEEVIRILQPLREAWSQVASAPAAADARQVSR
jgi:flagellar secretion chaperone FliS